MRTGHAKRADFWKFIHKSIGSLARADWTLLNELSRSKYLRPVERISWIEAVDVLVGPQCLLDVPDLYDALGTTLVGVLEIEFSSRQEKGALALEVHQAVRCDCELAHDFFAQNDGDSPENFTLLRVR